MIQFLFCLKLFNCIRNKFKSEKSQQDQSGIRRVSETKWLLGRMNLVKVFFTSKETVYVI